MKKYILLMFMIGLVAFSTVDTYKKVRKYFQVRKQRIEKEKEFKKVILEQRDKDLKEHENNLKELEEERIRLEKKLKELDERYNRICAIMDDKYYSKIRENDDRYNKCSNNKDRLDILCEEEKILNDALNALYEEGIIGKPWEGNFDEFMSNPNNQLKFD